MSAVASFALATTPPPPPRRLRSALLLADLVWLYALGVLWAVLSIYLAVQLSRRAARCSTGQWCDSDTSYGNAIAAIEFSVLAALACLLGLYDTFLSYIQFAAPPAHERVVAAVDRRDGERGEEALYGVRAGWIGLKPADWQAGYKLRISIWALGSFVLSASVSVVVTSVGWFGLGWVGVCGTGVPLGWDL